MDLGIGVLSRADADKKREVKEENRRKVKEARKNRVKESKSTLTKDKSLDKQQFME